MMCGNRGVVTRECDEKEHLEDALIAGYKEMSRINLSLAEEAVASDNEAALLSEQCIRSVNECDS